MCMAFSSRAPLRSRPARASADWARVRKPGVLQSPIAASASSSSVRPHALFGPNDAQTMRRRLCCWRRLAKSGLAKMLAGREPLADGDMGRIRVLGPRGGDLAERHEVEKRLRDLMH